MLRSNVTEATYPFRSEATPPYNQVRILQFKQDENNAEERTQSGWASTPHIDSYDEIILPSAYEKFLPDFMRNPVHYWNHQWYEIPIGHVQEARVENEGLWVKNYFGETALAQEVWQAVREGSVRSMSVGFRGYYTPQYGYWDDEQDLFIWTLVQLLEVSTVGMPANSYAQYQLSRALGLPMLQLGRSVNLPIASTNGDYVWDPHEATKNIAKWGANAGPDRTDGLYLFSRELPLVDVLDGKPQLVWDGIACACAQLLGARGGVDLPEAAKRTAFKSLAHLYERVGKEVPTWEGDWPSSFKSVSFKADEPEILERTVAMDNVHACERASSALDNIGRHWKNEGRGPSAEMLRAAKSSILRLESFVSQSSDPTETHPSGRSGGMMITLTR